MVDSTQRTLEDLVFVGFNSRVVALDRYTGETVWTWKAPKGTGYAAVLVDGDRLIVCVNGYAYCLEPVFGQEVWRNEMKGLGTGVTCIASANGAMMGTAQLSGQFSSSAAIHAQKQAAAASAAAAG